MAMGTLPYKSLPSVTAASELRIDSKFSNQIPSSRFQNGNGSMAVLLKAEFKTLIWPVDPDYTASETPTDRYTAKDKQTERQTERLGGRPKREIGR